MLVTLAAAAVAGAALAAPGPPALHASAATSSSTPAKPGFAVSEAVDSVSGNTYIAAQGPGHSLYFYWNLSGTWYGPLAVGAPGSTFSAPSLTIDNNHNVVIAAQGPSNTLWFYWNVKGTWYGPLQIGAPGSAVSTPSIAIDGSHNLDVAVMGPNKTTTFVWGISGTWYGPYTLGSAGMSLTAPSVSASGSTLYVATQGPNNSLVVFENSSGTWANPAESNAQTTFAAPSNAFGEFYVQGAGQDLDDWYWAAGPPATVYGDYPVGPGGLTQSAPAALNSRNVVALGPSNSLYFYWYAGSGWHGPAGIGAAGSSYSIPAIASQTNVTTNSNPAVAVEGPNNSLYFYWNISGTWYGPLGVGGPGTTFSSAS